MLKYQIPGWFHKNKENRPTWGHLVIALVGSFTGIAIAAYLSLNYDMALLVPSFGATAVLLYAASHVPMAQPKNVLGGHLVSAIIGVAIYKLLGLSWWTLALGVALAIVAMMVTDTLHPPGGATAFAAVYTHQDFSFVYKPVAIGVAILIVVALVLHRYAGQRKYPVRSELLSSGGEKISRGD
jgi:CBS-domain-containing membrane protein